MAHCSRAAIAMVLTVIHGALRHGCRLQLEEVDEALQERFQLCRSVAVECVTDAELMQLLRKKPNPIAYDGFEPSGRMHIAQVGSRGAGHFICSLYALPLLSRHCRRRHYCRAAAAACDGSSTGSTTHELVTANETQQVHVHSHQAYCPQPAHLRCVRNEQCSACVWLPNSTTK